MNLNQIEPNLFVGSCPHDVEDVARLRWRYGITRSTTTVIAYLHRSQSWELADALGHVLRQRACDPLVQAIVAADWSA